MDAKEKSCAIRGTERDSEVEMRVGSSQVSAGIKVWITALITWQEGIKSAHREAPFNEIGSSIVSKIRAAPTQVSPVQCRQKVYNNIYLALYWIH